MTNPFLEKKPSSANVPYNPFIEYGKEPSSGPSWDKAMPPTLHIPEIPPENVYANSDEFQALLEKALRQGEDSLTPSEQKQIEASRKAIPEVEAAFQQQEEQQEVTRRRVDAEIIQGQVEAIEKEADDFHQELPPAVAETTAAVYPTKDVSTGVAWQFMDEHTPNVIKKAYNQSLTGVVTQLLAGDQYKFKIEDTDPNMIEDVASLALSFMMPLDMATFWIGGGMGTVAAKASGKVLTQKLVTAGVKKALAEKAVGRAMTRSAERAMTSGVQLGTYSGIHSAAAQGLTEEGVSALQVTEDALKNGALGIILGTAGGLAKPLGGVKGSSRFRKVAGGGAEKVVEVGAFGTGTAAIEGRMPTWDDYVHATALVTALSVNALGLKAGKKTINKIGNKLYEGVHKGDKTLQEATLELCRNEDLLKEIMEGTEGKLTPESISFLKKTAKEATNNIDAAIHGLKKTGKPDTDIQILYLSDMKDQYDLAIKESERLLAEQQTKERDEALQAKIEKEAKEKEDALQKPEAEKMDARQKAEDGKEVGKTHPKGKEVTDKGKAEEVKPKPEAKEDVTLVENAKRGMAELLDNPDLTVEQREKIVANSKDLDKFLETRAEEKTAEVAKRQKEYDDQANKLTSHEQEFLETESKKYKTADEFVEAQGIVRKTAGEVYIPKESGFDVVKVTKDQLADIWNKVDKRIANEQKSLGVRAEANNLAFHKQESLEAKARRYKTVEEFLKFADVTKVTKSQLIDIWAKANELTIFEQKSLETRAKANDLTVHEQRSLEATAKEYKTAEIFVEGQEILREATGDVLIDKETGLDAVSVTKSQLIDIWNKANKPITEPKPKPESEPVKAAEKIALKKDVFKKKQQFTLVKVGDLKVDTDRFQNRIDKYSEASVQKVTRAYKEGKFDPDNFEPLHIWVDPAGKEYILAGHSRYEAAKRLKWEDIPIIRRKFPTEEEAIQWAKEESNYFNTSEGKKEQVANFKKQRERGATEKKLRERWGENYSYYKGYSYLDPNGKFLETVTQLTFSDYPYLKKWSRTVGNLRETFPELTNTHEQQIFDQLYPKDKSTGLANKISKQGALEDIIQKQVSDIYWTPNLPIKIKHDPKPMVGARAADNTKEIVAELDRLEEYWNETIKRVQKKEISNEKANGILEDLQKQKDKLKAGIKDIVDRQGDMFASAEVVEPVETKGGGFGVNPFTSLREKYARALKMAEGKREKGIQGEIVNTPSMFIDRPKRDIGLLESTLRTPTNVFGATPGQRAKLGEAARKAMRNFVLTERNIIVESGRLGHELENILSQVDKADWGKRGSKFYDHVADPSKDGELQPSSLKAAKETREFMERIRQEILTVKRDKVRPLVSKVIEREWRAENDLKGKKLKDNQREELNAAIEKGVEARIPNWGLDNYLPQMHPGKWVVQITEGMGPDAEVTQIGTARTPSDALNVAMEHYGNNPQLSPDAYFIKGRAFKGRDVLRTTRPRFWKIVNEMAKEAEGHLSKDQIAAFLRGTIGTKEGKQKFAGFLQQRKGVEGYSKDITKVLSTYVQTYARWKELTDLSAKTEPLLRQVRAEGRTGAANALQSIFDNLWGQSPSKLTNAFDATLQKVPGVRDIIAPNALDRWVGTIKGGVMTTFLKLNARFHFLNSLQTYQTLAPGVTREEWVAGREFMKSKEGEAAMRQHGVEYLTGGKYLESGKVMTSPKLRAKMGRIAPETYNQRRAWATMYTKAKKMGYSDANANDYAFLKGNIWSQFLHLSSDRPLSLRGPISSTIFQFKRFPIKNLEMGCEFIADKNYPAFGKWIGAQLLFGGTRIATKVIPATGVAYVSYETYKAIKEECGEEVANTVAYGLPGLLGLDMSYSIMLLDMPFGEGIPEKIGNMLLSPGGSVAVRAGRAFADDKGYVESPWERAGYATTQSVPAFKSLVALRALCDKTNAGEYNFRDPAGRLKFKGDAKDLIVTALGGRTTTQANIDMKVEALTDIVEKRDPVLDKLTMQLVESVETDEEVDLTIMDEWNELWPEFPITTEDVLTRANRRYKIKDMDRAARTLYRGNKSLRAMEVFQPEE